MLSRIDIDDANQCMRVSDALDAGTVSQCELCGILSVYQADRVHQIWVNQYGLLYNNVAFGGKKQSGIGK